MGEVGVKEIDKLLLLLGRTHSIFPQLPQVVACAFEQSGIRRAPDVLVEGDEKLMNACIARIPPQRM